MNRLPSFVAFLTGLAALAWIAAGYAGTNLWALAMTLGIAAFYCGGAFELHRFRSATASLSQALTLLEQAPASLPQWLGTLPVSLRQAVRSRVEGERMPLPGPALAPYLTGLLVLLGMLGTFVGMVATLKGTGVALEGAADVQAARAALSAPVKGLGLAFGTSVAGVAASAMLGLMSALARRERLLASQALDARVATVLRPFSPAHRREQAFELMQRQAGDMPLLAERLQAMASALQQHAHTLGQQLVEGQRQFHQEAAARTQALADSVERSLRESLAQGARVAGETLQPAVEAAVQGIARQATELHEKVAREATRLHEQVAREAASLQETAARQTTELQLEVARQTTGLQESVARGAATLHEGVAAQVQQQLEAVATRVAMGFEQRSAELVAALADRHGSLQAELASRDEQRLSAWTGTLREMAQGLGEQWQQAGDRTLAQQQQVCGTLEHTARVMSEQSQAHARETLAEIARLVQTASEAPRAAAEVIGELRGQLSESMARDNALLDERARLLQTLGTLLQTLTHAGTEQRSAIDALVASAASQLQGTRARFEQVLQAEGEKLAAVAAQVTGSAVEVSALGETFGFAVQRFGESNDKLVAQLERIEGALGQSLARSDEQLAYYVAQAREVIDLSLTSQKQIVDDLQRLAAQRSDAAEPV